MGSRRILGIFVHCPSEPNVGIDLYQEFDTIDEFIEFSEKEANKHDFGYPLELTFEKYVQYWQDNDGNVGYIYPEYCEKHKKFWGKQVPRTDVDDCPDCFSEQVDACGQVTLPAGT